MGGIARTKLQSVTFNNPDKTYKGYTLFAPIIMQSRIYLIDMEGRFINYWQLPGRPGEVVGKLLPNGNVLCPVRIFRENAPVFSGWCGADILELDWNNNVVWKYRDNFQHHQVRRLRNGNTMIIRAVPVPPEIADKIQGGQPHTEDGGIMWTDSLREVTPDGKVAWEWLAYEHLDPKIDVICPLEHREEWTHGNTIEELDNGDILTCFRYISTVVIIDKKTGNIKWRWGSGEIYHPHDPTMLDNGNILLFDNGVHRRDSYFDYSRAVEVNPKTSKIEWEYRSDPPTEFYSSVCGSCQRLPNGNTLICEATKGRIFEVTYDKELVWEYVCPFFSPSTQMRHGTLAVGRNSWLQDAYRHSLDFEGFKGKDLDPNRFKLLNEVYGPETFKLGGKIK